MSTERWLTLPRRAGVRSPELTALIQKVGGDLSRAWDSCEDPRLLAEMGAAAGMPVEVLLGAVAKVCADAWSHWTAGATDTRPMQILNAVQKWLRRDAGFEEIWATWELAEQLSREVRAWYQQQQGAVVATAILSVVDAIHAFVTTARNLAEPEPGHDQYDPQRYAQKNADPAYEALLHDAANAVKLATKAGSWFHSHTEPKASEDDHDAYAKQIVGFVLRQHLPSDQVVAGLRARL
ncbi:MAG: hypothetical protein K8H88_07090 [Sandaracinaceae bacterium]|nr:hypothetical protein [Sandaracinaceae bacterium]